MNKQAYLEETYKEAFSDELEKIGVSIDSLEDTIGGYLSDEQEEVARDMIAKATKKSWAMRHPFLSLGVGYGIAHGKANQEISRKMIKSDPALMKLINKKKKRRHQLAVAEASAPKIDVNNTNISEAPATSGYYD